jgi:hypothetical protein
VYSMLQNQDMESGCLQVCCSVQNQDFCQNVVKKKGVKTIYFVILLADISPISNNPYTEFVIIGTNYNV